MKWFVRLINTPDAVEHQRVYAVAQFEAPEKTNARELAVTALTTLGVKDAGKVVDRDVTFDDDDFVEEGEFDFQIYTSDGQWEVLVTTADQLDFNFIIPGNWLT